MNDKEILESALTDALADQLAMRNTITALADARLRDSSIYRSAVREFALISHEIRQIRLLLN